MQDRDGVWNLVDAAYRKDAIKGKSLMTREDGTVRTLLSVWTGHRETERGQIIDTRLDDQRCGQKMYTVRCSSSRTSLSVHILV